MWNMAVSETSKFKVVASGVIPFAFVVVMMLYIFGPGADLLDLGVALPEVTIEKVDFFDSEIQATVRNTCLLYTSPSPRDRQKSRMPSSA